MAKQEPLSSLCRRAVEAGIDVTALRQTIAADCRRPDGTVNSAAASAKLRSTLAAEVWRREMWPHNQPAKLQPLPPLKIWVCGAQCTGVAM